MRSPSHAGSCQNTGRAGYEGRCNDASGPGTWGAYSGGLLLAALKSNASTGRAPTSSVSSCSRRAVPSAWPSAPPSCGPCVSASFVPACLQSWWYLPRITSFATISSMCPGDPVDVTFMVTVISSRRKRSSRPPHGQKATPAGKARNPSCDLSIPVVTHSSTCATITAKVAS